MLDITAPAKGEYLTNIGTMFGMKRRFFGFEPDWLFRIRVLKTIARSIA